MRRTVRLGIVVLVFGALGGCGAQSGSSGPPAGPATVFPSDVRVSHNLDTDATWARIAASGRSVYVVWLDGREDGLNVFFNRSADGGATWQPADIRIDHPHTQPTDAGPPVIACEGDLVVIVWEDDRNGHYDLFLNRSFDGGVTWESRDTRLDTDLPGAADSGLPALAVTAESIYVAWTDDRTGSNSIHVSASQDAGNTWPVSDVQIDGDTTGVVTSWVPEVTALGDHVFVVWSDDRYDLGGHSDVFGRSSADGGQTWEPIARLDTSPRGSAHSAAISLARSGGDVVHAAWQDDRIVGPSGPAANVFVNRSVDGGAAWGDPDRPLTQNTSIHDVFNPLLCSWGAQVFCVWGRFLPNPSLAYRIEDRRSLDAGQTWGPTGTDILPSTAPISQLGAVLCACTANHVFVVWRDDHASTAGDVYLKHAAWTGSFATSAVRLNTPPSAAGRVWLLDVCTGRDDAYALWQDDRDGYFALFMNAARP